MNIQKKYKRLVSVFSIIMTMVPLFLSCRSEEKETCIDLGGTWQLSREHAPDTFAKPTAITIPGSWNDVIRNSKDYAATVRLEKVIFIKNEMKGKSILLTLGRIGVCDELYINKKLAARTGSIPKTGNLSYHFTWQMPRRYFINSSMIKYGEENRITLRVFSHIITGIEGPVKLHFPETGTYRGLYDTHLPLIFNIVAIALNILFFCIMLLLYLSKKRKRIYLYFSLMLLFTIAGNFAVLDFDFPVIGLFRARAFLITYSTVNFFALIALKRFFEIRNRYISPAAVAILILVELAVIISPDTGFLFQYGAPAAIAFGNTALLTATVLFAVALKRDPRQYWYFLFVALPVPLSAMRNSWYLATLRFYELPLFIFMHIPLAFTIFMLYYIYDLERSKNEKDSLYSALLKKSKNIERILKSLQKDNAKPEPKDIIQDLTEYLDTNYQERYDRKELSTRFNLNEDYMGQIFKKVTGTNISNYLNTRRIDAAKELLIDTDAKIIDIAYHVGFDNLTHFHRQFKKQTGLTPNEYRTLMTKEIQE